MTATPAQRSKTYHDKQRAKLARAEAMEAALTRIIEIAVNDFGVTQHARLVAIKVVAAAALVNGDRT